MERRSASGSARAGRFISKIYPPPEIEHWAVAQREGLEVKRLYARRIAPSLSVKFRQLNSQESRLHSRCGHGRKRASRQIPARAFNPTLFSRSSRRLRPTAPCIAPTKSAARAALTLAPSQPIDPHHSTPCEFSPHSRSD